ncbi:CAP domain-containing protein [Lactobacillaceae bacterium Scapto_B20]
MRKSFITIAVAIGLLSSGAIVVNNNIVDAKATLTKQPIKVNNNYRTNQFKYQQSVKLYHTRHGELTSIGYTTINDQNQNKLQTNRWQKINEVKYVYINLFKGSWIKQSDVKKFQNNLTKFKQAYQSYHANKNEQSTASSQASDSSAASNGATLSSQTNTNNAKQSQSQIAQSILNDTNFKAAYRTSALAEINKLRSSVGVATLVENPTLDQIADARIAQNIARGDGTISHYDSSGNALNVSVANQLHLTAPLAENIAMRTLSDSTDANDIAYEITHQYIDEGPENNDGKDHGHYENLVSPDIKTIGISFGITTTPDSKGYIYMYDAEELSASSSYDINNNIISNLNQATSN